MSDDLDTNVDTTIETTGQEVNQSVDSDKGTEKLSIREHIEKGFEEAKKAELKAKDPKTGQFVKTSGQRSRKAEMDDPNDTPAEPEKAGDEVTVEPDKAPAAVGEAPAAWAKEARDIWAQVPPAAQAAILKREADGQKGVESLKAQYSELDRAIAPHLEAIKNNGHTPGQAVHQLFAWFQALAQNPDVAFPALAKSFNYQWKGGEAVAEPEKTADEQPAGAIPSEVQSYIDKMRAEMLAMKQELGQQVSSLSQGFQQQSEAKTQEIVHNWAKDKPHFENVRGLMAQLIQSGAVPLKDGRVDLDGAYQMAIYANPEVRSAVLQEEQAKKAAEAKAKKDAEAKAQADAAAKARDKGMSLDPASAPGQEVSKKAPGKKGSSVRESLQHAINEVREARA
jgi:hypothetical protein